MKSRIFLKLMGSAMLLIVLTAGVLDFGIRRLLTQSLQAQIERSLEEKTALFGGRLPDVAAGNAGQVAREVAQEAGCRATIIDASGKVLADSEADAGTMENHARRPEVAAALGGKPGHDVRVSRTTGQDYAYAAVPVRGGVVRLAYPLSEVRAEVSRARQVLLYDSALALLIATVLAGLAAWSISRRLRRIMLFAERMSAGHLHARVADGSSDEIGKLASALDATAQTIEQSFQEIAASRAQLESLLNSLQDAVFATDGSGRVLWANGTMSGIVRVRIGDRVSEVVRDPEVLAAIEQARAGKATSSQRAFAVMPGRAYQVSAAPLAPQGAVVLLHDITQIERLEKMRRDFVANVSHELRTPLTMIQGYAETLRDTAQDGSGFLDIICRNAARVTRLTEDLLMLARVESGELKLKLETVPVAELLEDAHASFANAASAKGIELRIEPELPDMSVKADKDAVHQVFTNLIANALNYAEGTRTIEIGAEKFGRMVDLYVRDHGPGISSEHQPRLFERFYRIDRARSRETGGTGLGLAIVKHIVLAHGGEVRVESRLGQGATFHFTLPAA